MTSNKPPTVTQIAAAAGVSVSTAARVLRNSTYPVDPALKEMVEKAAATLGYVPNVIARNLRGGAPNMLGLIVGDMMDPYYGEIAEATTERAESSYGMLALVSNMQRDPLLEIKHCRQMWENRVAGLILSGGGFDQWTHFKQLATLIEQMQGSNVIVVSLSPRGLDIPAFCMDNVSIGATLARHLIDNGHTNIGILMGPLQSEVTQQRLRGIEDVLLATGAKFEVIHAEYSAISGERAVAELVSRGTGQTGFIVGSNMMALGAINWLERAGRRVPDDVLVVGVGASKLSGWFSPKLTTVDVNLSTYARAAVDYVAAGVRGGEQVGPPKLDATIHPATPVLAGGL